MRETREIAMEETVPRRQSTSNTPLRALRAVGTSLLLVLLFAGNALAQAIAVTGTVSGAGGQSNHGLPSRIRCAVGSPSVTIRTTGSCSECLSR